MYYASNLNLIIEPSQKSNRMILLMQLPVHHPLHHLLCFVIATRLWVFRVVFAESIAVVVHKHFPLVALLSILLENVALLHDVPTVEEGLITISPICTQRDQGVDGLERVLSSALLC
jgi:hypothetical protein